MRVTLTADPQDFSINSLNTQDQLVHKVSVTRWEFDVTPCDTGGIAFGSLPRCV